MAKLIPFSFESKEIRIQEAENGEILFYAKDVFLCLDLVLRQDALDRLDSDSYISLITSYVKNETDNKLLNVWLTESGVYELILSSRKEEAKRFKRWVTREVLPSVRKTGTYSLPSVASKPLPTNYVEALRALLEAEESKLALEEKQALLVAKIEEQKPQVEFFQRVGNSEDTIDIGEAAKVLKLTYGRNTLFKVLRERKILDAENIPYQSYINAGYFTVDEIPYEASGETRIHLKTKVTQKRLQWLSSKLT